MQFGAVSNPQAQKNHSTHEEATTCDEAGSFGSGLIISAPHDITSETIHHDTSKKEVKCQAIYDNLTVEVKTIDTREMCNLDYDQPLPIGLKDMNSKSINGSGRQCGPSVECVYGEVNSESIKVDQSDGCASKATNLQTLIHSGDGQSIQVASGSGEDIAKGVNERSKATADRNLDLNDKPWMKQSSEQHELNLQVDQTAEINNPSLSSSPNTASGVALHCASAGGTSCGNSEVIVLSNQAS